MHQRQRIRRNVRDYGTLNKFSKANSFANSSSPKSIHIYTKREEIILHVEGLLKYSFWVIRNEVIIPLNIISYLFFWAENRGWWGVFIVWVGHIALTSSVQNQQLLMHILFHILLEFLAGKYILFSTLQLQLLWLTGILLCQPSSYAQLSIPACTAVNSIQKKTLRSKTSVVFQKLLKVTNLLLITTYIWRAIKELRWHM